MAANNKVNQQLEQRSLEKKDHNSMIVKICLLVLAIDALLWTNPVISFKGLVSATDFLSNGFWTQGAAILFYGIGLLGIFIPLGWGWYATKQMS